MAATARMTSRVQHLAIDLYAARQIRTGTPPA